MGVGAERHELAPRRPRVAELLEADLVQLAIQPIVRASSHEAFAYEALVRCRHAAFQGPQSLFEAASGEGCRDQLEHALVLLASDWLHQIPEHARLFVNLDPSCVRGERALRAMLEPLSGHAPRVTVEVGADQLGQSSLGPETVAEIVEAAGFSLSIDRINFRDLPLVERLKPMFFKTPALAARSVTFDEGTRRVLLRIGQFADSCGCGYVALGVEQRAEAEVLAELGISFLQGYLFGVPKLSFPAHCTNGHWGW